MTQAQAVKKLHRAHRTSIEMLMSCAYQEGFDAGLARAHGAGRRRPSRDLLSRYRIEDH